MRHARHRECRSRQPVHTMQMELSKLQEELHQYEYSTEAVSPD